MSGFKQMIEKVSDLSDGDLVTRNCRFITQRSFNSSEGRVTRLLVEVEHDVRHHLLVTQSVPFLSSTLRTGATYTFTDLLHCKFPEQLPRVGNACEHCGGPLRAQGAVDAYATVQQVLHEAPDEAEGVFIVDDWTGVEATDQYPDTGWNVVSNLSSTTVDTTVCTICGESE